MDPRSPCRLRGDRRAQASLRVMVACSLAALAAIGEGVADCSSRVVTMKRRTDRAARIEASFCPRCAQAPHRLFSSVPARVGHGRLRSARDRAARAEARATGPPAPGGSRHTVATPPYGRSTLIVGAPPAIALRVAARLSRWWARPRPRTCLPRSASGARRRAGSSMHRGRPRVGRGGPGARGIPRAASCLSLGSKRRRWRRSRVRGSYHPCFLPNLALSK
jgi:hypothetical protein